MQGSGEFEPSFKVLRRIMQPRMEEAVPKAELSRQSRVSYARFRKHLEWCQSKEMIRLTVDEHRIVVKITDKGEAIARILFDDHQ